MSLSNESRLRHSLWPVLICAILVLVQIVAAPEADGKKKKKKKKPDQTEAPETPPADEEAETEEPAEEATPAEEPEGPIVDGEWVDDRYASRPEAAEPPSLPYVGAPIGSIYAPSTVIYPEQDLPIRFFHDMHMEANISCDTCHSGAAASDKAADYLLPPMEDCLDCHVIEDGVDAFPPSDCTTCHTSYVTELAIFDEDIEDVDEDSFREVDEAPSLPRIPTQQLKFTHKAHVDAEIECATCHGDLSTVQLATSRNLPTMNLCLTCHTGAPNEPSDACATCHVANLEGRLITSLPTGLLVPTGRFRNDDHRFDYLERHRKTTAADSQYCTNCHTESYCEDCHNGVVKPLEIHPPNYAQIHAIDAYSDEKECYSCHTRTDFCLGCHTQVGLTVDEARGTNAFSYHPDGWVQTSAIAGVRSEHASAAERNMGACASCHQESLCLDCHSTWGTNVGNPVNPHPSNWLDKCSSMMSRNATSCYKCHLPGDEDLDLCR